MANANLLNKKAQELAHEARDYVAEEASEWIDNGVASVEAGLENAADQVKEGVQETLKPRRIPWLGIAAGVALVAGAVYLARHRAQRVVLQKAVKKGVQGGAVLALMLPGGLRKARESADRVLHESARLWEKVEGKIPVRVVVK
ncbi:MAG: hypothetical protein K0Q91_1314 [Fibrobacteria bacterium]|nr:hypothetical protein [Fibrobacteria bacterium]